MKFSKLKICPKKTFARTGTCIEQDSREEGDKYKGKIGECMYSYVRSHTVVWKFDTHRAVPGHALSFLLLLGCLGNEYFRLAQAFVSAHITNRSMNVATVGVMPLRSTCNYSFFFVVF